MKQFSILSYLFGVLMLVSIGCQLFEQSINLPVNDDSIELSDLLEGNQEDAEDGEKLFTFHNLILFRTATISQRTFPIVEHAYNTLSFYIKIPVPPPDIV